MSFKMLIIRLLVLQFLLSVTDTASLHAQPRLTISLEDSTFLLRQSVWITASLINTTSQTVRYEFFMFEDPEIKIRLWDSKGHIYSFDGIIFTHAESQIQYLNPGDTVTKVGNLLDNYGLREFNYPSWKYLPQEAYHLYACFTLSNGETVCSDTSSFQVIKPQGSLNEQHNLIVNARKACLIQRNHKLEAELYDNLLTTYPNSPYEDMVLYELERSPVNQRVIQEEIMNKLLETHPQSHYAEREVQNKAGNYWYYGKKQEATDYLNGIIKKYPNSRVSKKAEELLKEHSQ